MQITEISSSTDTMQTISPNSDSLISSVVFISTITFWSEMVSLRLEMTFWSLFKLLVHLEGIKMIFLFILTDDIWLAASVVCSRERLSFFSASLLLRLLELPSIISCIFGGAQTTGFTQLKGTSTSKCKQLSKSYVNPITM